MAGHVAGDPLQCYGIPIVLHKQPVTNEYGEQIQDDSGRPRYRCGFRLGGGIDQDPSVSPQGYPDKGIYVTYIYAGSPAEQAGLQVHDKILQNSLLAYTADAALLSRVDKSNVNGCDLTVVTHKKAVEYISRKAVLNLVVYRKGIPQMQQQQHTAPPPSSRQPVYDQQRSVQQQPIYQSQQQPIYQSQQQPYHPQSSSSYGKQPVGQSRYPAQSSPGQVNYSRQY